MKMWDQPGVPHKGWILLEVYDSIETYGHYETCEMCQNEHIRYVHVLKHPNYKDILHVGCICSCNMTEDYSTPYEYEQRIKNRANRRKNFLSRKWRLNEKGNYILRYNGVNITAIVRNGSFGFCCYGKWIWKYKEKRIYDMDTLKLAAFEAYEENDICDKYDMMDLF